MKKVLMLLLLFAGLAWADRVQVSVKIDRKTYKNTRQIIDLIQADSPRLGEIIIIAGNGDITIGYMVEADSLQKDTLALAPWKRITGISVKVDTVKALRVETKQAEP